VEATLTELLRNTAKYVRPAIQGRKVTITEHGKPVAQILPVKPFDRVGALKALGPVELPSRK
jgi:prevent-host-death family protein